MRFTFANRLREIELIRSFANANADAEARLCVIAGPSGIGKSRLVDEAIAGVHGAAPLIRVHIKESDIRCGESGFFLRSCALALAERQKSVERTSLEGFARRRGGLATIRKTIGSAAKALEKVSTGSEAVSDLMAVWGEHATTLKELLGQPSAPALRLAADYLSRVLTTEPIVLVLENAQLIDSESLHYLHGLLEKCPDTRLVYEFTIDPPGVSGRPVLAYDKFLAACRAVEVGTVEIELGMLDFDVLAQCNFERQDRRYVETLRSEFQAALGNVRDIERLHEIVGRRIDAANTVSGNTLGVELSKLSSAQRTLLWIVALMDRDLDVHELTEICARIPETLRPDAPLGIARSLAPFVDYRDGLFSVDHDSLLPRLQAVQALKREQLLAANVVSDYFKQFLERADYSRFSEYEILFALLGLSLPLNSPDLVDFAISRLAYRTRSTGRPTGLLKLITNFSQSGNGDVLHRHTIGLLIRIIYDACWIEGALSLSARHKHQSPDIWLCYCHALGFVGRHDEAEAELAGLHQLIRSSGWRAPDFVRLEAYAKLTGALIARMRGAYSLALERYEALSPHDFATDSERCLYYRYAEVAGAADAMHRLEEGRHLALTLSDPIHLVRTNISLAMMRAEVGRVAEARGLLDEASAAGPSNYVDLYMLANNRLVSELFDGGSSAATYDALVETLPLVVEALDRILITNNLLAAAVLMNNVPAAMKYAQSLEALLPHIVEPNARRISYFNCSRFHERCGSQAVAKSYREIAFGQALGFDDAYWSARKAETIQPNTDFRLSVAFDLPMMSNWYFNLPQFELPSQ